MIIRIPTTRSPLDTLIESTIPLRINVGQGTYFGDSLNINYYPPSAHLRIGRFCSIADDVQFHFSGGHDSYCVSTYPNHYFHEDMNLPVEGLPQSGAHEEITVGNDVWIGTAARVMAGVRVGDGAIIGSFSVVAKDVPPYSVVVGNPARQIRQRFDPQDIAFLQELNWWDLGDDAITRLSPWIFSRNIVGLRQAVAAIPPSSGDGTARKIRHLFLNLQQR